MSNTNSNPRFLDTLGTLSYGDYEFDGASLITVDSTNVRDDADRTTLYIRHDITVKAVVAPVNSNNGPVSADDFMQQVRQALTTDGQPLVFENKGFADALSINTGAQRDVKWGPKTDLIHWEPIGGSYAVEIIWKCRVHLPECCGGATAWTGLMAFNYEVDFDIDQHGNTTRTINGYLEIAQTRLNSSGCTALIVDSADNYWERVAPLAPTGYKREKRRHLSKDKSRLDFSIIDSQIPSENPWPPYCTDARGRHRIHWNRMNGALQHGSISMDLTLQTGAGGTVGWLAFGTLVAQRLASAYQDPNKALLINELEVEEDLFGRACSFRMGYQLLGTIKDFIGDHRLWRPLGTNWSQWAFSLQGSMFAPRGTSLLRNPPSFDTIVDLCNAGATAPGDPGAVYQANPQQTPTFKNQKPTPQRSWMHYKTRITPRKKQPTVRQKTLQAPESFSTQWNPADTGGFNFASNDSVGGMVPDTIVQRGIGSYSVLFEGMAVRAGYPVPRPSIASVGDQQVFEDTCEFPNGIVGNMLGVPIYAAAWRINYLLSGPPGTVPCPDDVQELVFNGQADAPLT